MKKFAFIIHPRQTDDIAKRFPWSCFLPNGLVDWVTGKLRGRLGFAICAHFNVLHKAEGYLVGVALTAKQMGQLPRYLVKGRIMDAVLFAQDKLGVERIGLGAYTAPFTYNGISIMKDKRIRCAVTHGDTLASAASVEAVKQGARIKGIDINHSSIAVVGAYGIIGRAASILVSELGPQKMILTGPNLGKLERVKKEVADNCQQEVSIFRNNIAIRDADIVILATTAPGNIVKPEMLKQNSVVVDMAQPHNMSEEVCRARPDVLRIDGGYMSIPGIDLGFDMGPPKGTTFACLTETIISTLVGDKENHVGHVDISFAKYIQAKSEELGFSLAPLTNFSRPL